MNLRVSILRRATRGGVVVIAVVAVAAVAVTVAMGGSKHGYSPWGEATLVAGDGVNTPAAEGCPIVSPNDKELYFASTRAGGVSGNTANDIWVSHRTSKNGQWGPPVNMGEPVNSAASDYCPSPMEGNVFFFVSTRGGGCGGADIYMLDDNGPGPDTAVNVGCTVNSSWAEWSPYLMRAGGQTYLFFSSDGHGGAGGQDIFMSKLGKDGFETPVAVSGGVNTSANEFRPNLRKDGLEMVFDSDRAGSPGSQTDVYSTTRESLDAPWGAVTPVGSANTPAGESRASFSWDGTTLYFGRAGDIYSVSRTKNGGND